MKLLLQEHLVAGEYFFAVDTHDQMEIKPDYPDYEQWMAVRRFNRELKRQIEQGLRSRPGSTPPRVCAQLLVECSDATAAAVPGLVLIVDDEEDLAAAVEVLIRRRGFRTYKVHDGLAGSPRPRSCCPT
jgi:hypothetical protein